MKSIKFIKYFSVTTIVVLVMYGSYIELTHKNKSVPSIATLIHEFNEVKTPNEATMIPESLKTLKNRNCLVMGGDLIQV